MPAGSGPSVTRVTGTAITAAEVVIGSITGNWSQPAGMANVQGNLLGIEANVTPGAGQTLITLRIRQGLNTLTGPVVGITHPETVAAAVQEDLGFNELDLSAFAQGPATAQSYTLTVQGNAAGPGIVNQAIIELSTTAPVQ